MQRWTAVLALLLLLHVATAVEFDGVGSSSPYSYSSHGVNPSSGVGSIAAYSYSSHGVSPSSGVGSSAAYSFSSFSYYFSYPSIITSHAYDYSYSYAYGGGDSSSNGWSYSTACGRLRIPGPEGRLEGCTGEFRAQIDPLWFYSEPITSVPHPSPQCEDAIADYGDDRAYYEDADRDYFCAEYGYCEPYVPDPPPDPYCSGTTSLTASSGTLSDGSGPSDYADFSNCIWVIAPSGATSVTLNFTSGHTESGWDFVWLYECNSTESCSLLDQLSGSLSGTYVSTTGIMKVVFTSDGSVSFEGFEASWTSSPDDDASAPPERVKPRATKAQAHRWADLLRTDAKLQTLRAHATEAKKFSERAAAGVPRGNTETSGGARRSKSKLSNSEGATKTRIVAGDRADPLEYPFMVSLQTTGGFHFCGGSLIHERFVLSAAHCFGGETDPRDVVVVIGEHRLQEGDPLASCEERRSVVRLYEHPAYNPETYDNDMALLELSAPSSYQPIPLHEGGDLRSDCVDSNLHIPLVTVGWGALIFEGGSPFTLQETTVYSVPTEYCSTVYGQLNFDAMLCAYDWAAEEPEEISDSCQGDSGGPLLLPDPTSPAGYQQVGVVSWGNGCAWEGTPGIYARVSTFTSWINSVVYGPPASGNRLHLRISGMNIQSGHFAIFEGEPGSGEISEIFNSVNVPLPPPGGWPGGYCVDPIPVPDVFASKVVYVVSTVSQVVDESRPPFVIEWGREGGLGCQEVGAHVSISEISRMMKTGSAFTGGLGRSGTELWACMRDWDLEEQRRCGIARGELVCFRSEGGHPFRFEYWGLNSELKLVTKEAYMAGLEKEKKHGLP